MRGFLHSFNGPMSTVGAFCEYLRKTGDRDTHLYEIGESPFKSPLEGPPPTFGETTYRIQVIDAFAQRRPVLVNFDWLHTRASDPLEFAIILVLDSQIASALHDYRLSRAGMDPERRRALQRLLRYASSRGYDYNPFFYLMESFHRNDQATFQQQSTDVVTSLLYLNCMDCGHFDATGEVLLDPDALDFYWALYGGRTLEECGRAAVERFVQEYESYDLLHCLRVSYVCLLKMTLIHKRQPGRFVEKFHEYQTFVDTELGRNLAYENLLAVYYFAELVGGLMRVQPGMALEKAKRILWSTAWDLFLLRSPEFLLAPKQLPRVNLGYVCSADRRLAELGELFTVLRLIIRAESHEIIGPLLAMNLHKLEQKVDPESVRAVQAITARSWPDFRGTVRRPPPKQDRVLALARDLEMQLTNLCRR